MKQGSLPPPSLSTPLLRREEERGRGQRDGGEGRENRRVEEKKGKKKKKRKQLLNILPRPFILFQRVPARLRKGGSTLWAPRAREFFPRARSLFRLPSPPPLNPPLSPKTPFIRAASKGPGCARARENRSGEGGEEGGIEGRRSDESRRTRPDGVRCRFRRRINYSVPP